MAKETKEEVASPKPATENIQKEEIKKVEEKIAKTEEKIGERVNLIGEEGKVDPKKAEELKEQLKRLEDKLDRLLDGKKPEDVKPPETPVTPVPEPKKLPWYERPIL